MAARKWYRHAFATTGACCCISLLIGCGSPSDRARGPLRAATSRVVELRAPSALALSRTGDLYVADFAANVVLRLDHRGRVNIVAGKADPLLRIGVAGTGGNGGPAVGAPISAPDGLALAPNGTLYIAEHASNRVRYVDEAGVIHPFDADGRISTFVSGLADPAGLALAANGDLYVIDGEKNCLLRIDQHRTVTTVRTGPLNAPRSVLVDDLGDIYLSDGGNSRIRLITPDGSVTTLLSSPG